MITPEHTPPYDRTALSKAYMAGQKEREGLGLKPDEFYEQMRISLLTGRTVARLDPQERCAVLENGDRVEFDRALVATGSRPRTAGIPGENLPGVHLLRSLADAEVISGTAEQAGTAVLLGAGFIGMELAGSLRERDLQVHVVAPEDVPLSNVFGERIGRWMQKRHQDNGTVFHMGTAAEKIERDGERKAVHLEDGTVLKADLVVVAMGVDPAVECLRDTGLVEDGAVPVTGHLETQAAGVFASGDIARLPDHRDGTPRRVEHWVEAERLGQHAARCMLGCDEPYREMPFFWTRQLGTSVRYIGWTEEWDETVWRGTPEDEEFLAGFYQDGVLRAAAGVGMAVDTIAVGELLKAGAGVAPENFQDTDYDLADALRQES
jgi:3-phenylpropionate/trans-cinnamate dioxygenase ferredoxin reductase subunit